VVGTGDLHQIEKDRPWCDKKLLGIAIFTRVRGSVCQTDLKSIRNPSSDRCRGRPGAALIRNRIAHPGQEPTADPSPLPELPGTALASVHCGFAVWVGLSLAEFWAHAADLFARHPIAAVRLDDRLPMHIAEPVDDL
jgi:hypothetical protein